MKNAFLVSLFFLAFLFGCDKNAKEEVNSIRPAKQDIESEALKPAISKIDRLIDKFRDRDISEQKCEEVAKELSDTGDAAIQPLIESLKDKDWRVRYYAVRALGLMKQKARIVSPRLPEDTIVVEALTEALKDQDPRVRRNICWAFAKIKDEKATESLIEVLKNDKDSDVRSEAAWALG